MKSRVYNVCNDSFLFYIDPYSPQCRTNFPTSTLSSLSALLLSSAPPTYLPLLIPLEACMPHLTWHAVLEVSQLLTALPNATLPKVSLPSMRLPNRGDTSHPPSRLAKTFLLSTPRRSGAHPFRPKAKRMSWRRSGLEFPTMTNRRSKRGGGRTQLQLERVG